MNDLLIALNMISQIEKKIDVKTKITLSNGTEGVSNMPHLIIEVFAKIKKGKFSGEYFSHGHSFSEYDLRHIGKGGEHFKLDYIARCFNKGYQEKENQP